MRIPVREVLLFILGVGLTGCLAADPEDVKIEQGSVPSEALVPHQTTAPLSLDPQILSSRSFGESPVLSDRVNRGELPMVADRLPENPLVVVPVNEIGKYGGRLRRALTGDIVQTPGVSKTMSVGLMGYERPLPRSVQLMMAESYTFEDEGRTAIFKIREGIRWSDGVPFTVDDILF